MKVAIQIIIFNIPNVCLVSLIKINKNMSFLLDTPQQLFRDSRRTDGYRPTMPNQRKHSFNNLSQRNQSFSMRSNSKRKPIFNTSQKKRSFGSDVFNTDKKPSNDTRNRNRIFDGVEPLNMQRKINQRLNSKTEDNEGEGFIYRPYNTGYFPRKRVIYVSQPENIEINYDYCGCESKLVPCAVLQSTFLNEISNVEMKKEYIKIFEDNAGNHLIVPKLKELLSRLPKNYPQIFTSQLRNLYPLLLTRYSSLFPEFLLLSWIQYHTKIQYITYFLFSDLRKSLNSYSSQLYINELERELIKQTGSPNIKQVIYTGVIRECSENFEVNQREIIKKFEDFLDHYLISGGAILVPVTYYARYLNLYKKKKGLRALTQVLAQIIKKDNGREIANVIVNWQSGDFNRYWSYIRGWDWQQIFENVMK